MSTSYHTMFTIPFPFGRGIETCGCIFEEIDLVWGWGFGIIWFMESSFF
jgi:hypothetical protein